MREILFRGKRLDNGEWVQGFFNKWAVYDESENNYHHYIQPLDENGRLDIIRRVHPATVGQFIGLTDQNGTNIFEGDIVSCRTSAYFFEKCKVVYESCYARYCLIDKHGYKYPMDESFEYEIIGNIYDNPELLEGNDDV